MELMDLPPEMLADVVARYVTMDATETGFRDAWKARLVCKTFRASIEYAIFAKQPFHDFKCTAEFDNWTITKDNMATLLRHKVRLRTGVQPLLPDYITGMRQWLLRDTPDAKEALQIKYENMLSQGIATACSRSWIFLSFATSSKHVRPHLPYFDNSKFLINRLAAAAAVGDMSNFKEVLQQLPELLWQASYVFGYPLAAAAAGNHIDLVKALVKNFEDSLRETPQPKYEKAFQAAVNAALICGHCDVVLLLLEVYHHYLPAIPERLYLKWVHMATRALDTVTTQALLKIQNARALTPMVNAITDIRRTGDVTWLRMLSERGDLRLNQSYDWPRTCHLSKAVGYRNLKVVSEMLKFGADPDGAHTLDVANLPLCVAIIINNSRIVKKLLSSGANPHLIVDEWNETTDSWRDERREIRVLLTKALEEYEVITKDRPPFRARIVTDAVDLTDSRSVVGS